MLCSQSPGTFLIVPGTLKQLPKAEAAVYRGIFSLVELYVAVYEFLIYSFVPRDNVREVRCWLKLTNCCAVFCNPLVQVTDKKLSEVDLSWCYRLLVSPVYEVLKNLLSWTSLQHLQCHE